MIGEHLRGIYVDNGRNVLDILLDGTRYMPETKKFERREEWEKEDRESELTKRKRSEREYRKLMNSINSDLKFTTETESDFQKLRLPTLSFELWSEKSGIRHSYFEKQMRSQVLTMQRSSQAETSKFSILVNELVRRFEVMDERIEISEEV